MTPVYPVVRYMGNKHRLLPWIREVLTPLPFESALDAFSGSGSVSYLFKSMGKTTLASDFLNFCHVLTTATVENSDQRVTPAELTRLLRPTHSQPGFIARTFTGIFYTPAELTFLDDVSANISRLEHPHKRALAMAALIRSCVKRQPRGVFTVAGDPERYKDGRRDLTLTLPEHFAEQIQAYNAAVFDNGRPNRSFRSDVFALESPPVDLVYLDPPYVPRADDNCYIKRYHFLEGLSCAWRGVEIMPTSKVRKLRKPFTPFSYRSKAVEAFRQLFARFASSILVLSYSSNGFPDLEVLVSLMREVKKRVKVHQREHTYHFGTHVAARRTEVREYLIVGR